MVTLDRVSSLMVSLDRVPHGPLGHGSPMVYGPLREGSPMVPPAERVPLQSSQGGFPHGSLRESAPMVSLDVIPLWSREWFLVPFLAERVFLWSSYGLIPRVLVGAPSPSIATQLAPPRRAQLAPRCSCAAHATLVRSLRHAGHVSISRHNFCAQETNGS